jgi:hypothetical protein
VYLCPADGGANRPFTDPLGRPAEPSWARGNYAVNGGSADMDHHVNGDPAVVGQTLQLNGRPFAVIGVAPEGFHGTTVLTGDVWVPVNMVGELAPRRSASILSMASAGFC